MSTAASELELVLVRFEPHQILFCDKRTKELYEYYPAANLDYRPDLQHEFLLRGLLFNEGLLYPKEASTLHTEMLMRSRTGQCLHTEE